MAGAEEDLRDCRRELVRVLIENAALRYAAMSFGDLAERLNSIVRRQPRLGKMPGGQRMTDDSTTTIAENPVGSISSLRRSDLPGSDPNEG